MQQINANWLFHTYRIEIYEMKIFDLKRVTELQSTEFYLRTVEI